MDFKKIIHWFLLAVLLIPISGFSQQFTLEKLSDQTFAIHAADEKLVIERGFSKFECAISLNQRPIKEYLNFEKKERYVYTFPLEVQFDSVTESKCLWWVRPCTDQECYFPSYYLIDRSALTLTHLTKSEATQWKTPRRDALGWLEKLIQWVSDWTFLLGLLLGIVAGINPCNLPLIPLILHYSQKGKAVWHVMLGAFVTIWGLMWILVKSGKFLGQSSLMTFLGNWVHLIFAVILIGFGLWAAKGTFNHLQRWITQKTQDLPQKNMGGFVWGIVFAFLSLPCVGPILALYGVLLFNTERVLWMSVTSFSLGFVSWFFLWTWMGKRLKSMSQKVFKIVEVTIGIAFILLGLWRGTVFIQGLHSDVGVYEKMTPQLETKIQAWENYTRLETRPTQSKSLYFLSAPWCVECQPYVEPIKKLQKTHSVFFINIDTLNDSTLNSLRAIGILGVPAFVFILDHQIYFEGETDIGHLSNILTTPKRP
jgi:cytochrome c biogenesis protein CcdA